MASLLLVRIQLTYTNRCMRFLEWIVDQATTTTLSSPIPNIVETTILPSPISNVEIANEGCQIGALELLEDLQSFVGVCQDDCVLGENSIDPLQVRVENEQWTLGSEGLGLDCQMTPSQSQSFPFTCKYELHTPNYSTFFDIFCNANRS
jgi:hypothetical protein